MTASARLFRTIDIVAVLTGVFLDRCGRDRVDELVRHVTAYDGLPKKGTTARRDVADVVRMQLPAGLDTFGIQELIGLIVHHNEGQQEDQLRATVIKILEERFGRELVLTPESTAETACKSLLLLRSLAEKPGAKIPTE